MLAIQLRKNLESIFEQQIFTAAQLPPQVQQSLINKIYPRYDRKKHSAKYIQKSNMDANSSATTFGSNGAINQKIISKFKMVGIFAYGNGDHAFYSLVNGKVYDHSHDFDGFSSLLVGDNRSNQKYLHPPMPYAAWE